MEELSGMPATVNGEECIVVEVVARVFPNSARFNASIVLCLPSAHNR